MLLNGFGWYCDCCGVCADQDCIKKADSRLPCKTNEVFSENMEHHWVKGALDIDYLPNLKYLHVCVREPASGRTL